MNKSSRAATVLLLMPLAAPLQGTAQQLPLGDVPPGVVAQSFGCAGAARGDAARRQCRLNDLRQTDAELNARYRDLRQALQAGEAQGLLSTQRAWLKKREATCRLDPQAMRRQAWTEYVADSQARSACVLDFTTKRLAELEQLRPHEKTATVTSEVMRMLPALVVASGETLAEDARPSANLLRATRSHRSGRHYFEIVIDEAHAGQVKATVTTRVGDGRRWAGTVHEVRARDIVLRPDAQSSIVIGGGNFGEIRVPKLVIGVAVDLDSGQLFFHRDGQWFGDAVPGAAPGIELERTGVFVAEVKTSVPLATLLDRGILKVNFGNESFERQPPAGFRGFDWRDHLAEAPAPKLELSSYPSGAQIAGDTQPRWLQRYWEWARSFPSAENPSADVTGARCGAGQSGPIWFLAGSKSGATVRRECEVPQGKIILVPIVITLAQANGASACEKLLVALRPFSSGVADLYFRLNGVAHNKPEQTIVGTGCFQLRDAATGQVGLAAGTGNWVFLEPLGRGRHVLEFGGRFTADGFKQDISYVLHVR